MLMWVRVPPWPLKGEMMIDETVRKLEIVGRANELNAILDLLELMDVDIVHNIKNVTLNERIIWGRVYGEEIL